MSNTDTVNELFELAISAELAAEHAYNRLAEMFAYYPEVNVFWKRYADEEVGHANWLKSLRERASAAELAAPADTNMFGMMHSLRELSVDPLLEKITNLDEAFQLAHDLENSEVNVVFTFLVDHFGADESTQAFIKTHLKNHTNHLLIDLPAQFRGAGARQGIKVLSAV